MKLEDNEYVIDFDRVNELTVHPTDNMNQTGYQPILLYGISRKLITKYLEIYTDSVIRGKEVNDSIIKTLLWNRILVGKSEIRDKRINEII